MLDELAVPFIDLRAQHATIADEVANEVAQVFASQGFILGPWVARFERALASFLGVEHAVGVACGTDALFLILAALGVGPGEAVVTTPFTFVSTVTSIIRAGARPLLVDVDPDTFTMDVGALREFSAQQCETGADGSLRHRGSGCRVAAVMPVHLFGRLANMEAISDLASVSGLEVIEDTAQALGARSMIEGRLRAAGTIGAAGALSFYPSKNLGGAGDGGAVVTNRAELAQRVRKLATHGSDGGYVHTLIGGNSRLDSVQAAVLAIKLKHLERWNDRRREIAHLYNHLIEKHRLQGVVLAPSATESAEHVFHQYVVQVPERDRVQESLAQKGVEARVYYPLPIHLQPCLTGLGYRQGDFPQAERLSKEVLSLPIYPELTDRAVSRVVSVLAEAVR